MSKKYTKRVPFVVINMARAKGNGACVTVPKAWLGKEIRCMLASSTMKGD